MRNRSLFLALFTLVAMTTVGHAQGVAGKWRMSYAGRTMMINGEMKVDTVTAILTIELKGDSIFGTFAPQNAAAQQAPRTITGTFKDDHLVFEASPVEARIRTADNNGEQEQRIEMRGYFDAVLKGDTLTGTMYSQSTDGAIESPHRPFSAQRAQ